MGPVESRGTTKSQRRDQNRSRASCSAGAFARLDPLSNDVVRAQDTEWMLKGHESGAPRQQDRRRRNEWCRCRGRVVANSTGMPECGHGWSRFSSRNRHHPCQKCDRWRASRRRRAHVVSLTRNASVCGVSCTSAVQTYTCMLPLGEALHPRRPLGYPSKSVSAAYTQAGGARRRITPPVDDLDSSALSVTCAH